MRLNASDRVPVILLLRDDLRHWSRVVASLRANRIPLVHVILGDMAGDSPRMALEAVSGLESTLHGCEVRLQRVEGTSEGSSGVLVLIDDIIARYGAGIVWEGDLFASPGTYLWLCAALRSYQNAERVLGISGWTHARVTPSRLEGRPYFDHWGFPWMLATWDRAWRQLRETSSSTASGGGNRLPDPLPSLAPTGSPPSEIALSSRWRDSWELLGANADALCLRPPWSMVEKLYFAPGVEARLEPGGWLNQPLRPVPDVPVNWPEPRLHPQCTRLWQLAWPASDVRSLRTIGMAARRAFRRHVPKAWLVRWRRRGRRALFSGNYPTWDEARLASSGYEARVILDRAIASARAVRDRLAAWERDTVLFQIPEANVPLLCELQAAAWNGLLEVIDFGGALGSTFHQHRELLQGVSQVRWTVVEQPAFVEAGKAEFTTEELRFSRTLEDAWVDARSPTLLLSGVLPYLEDPYAWIQRMRVLPFQRVIVDRTGFVCRGDDRLTVQTVPEDIYPASYPCRFFNRNRLLAAFGREWSVQREWSVHEDVDISAEYRGMVLTRPREPDEPRAE